MGGGGVGGHDRDVGDLLEKTHSWMISAAIRVLCSLTGIVLGEQ